MAPVTVLVTFYSRSGATETLASSLAVGAVQARGLIRLRRLPDVNPDRTLAENPKYRETLLRMHKEYVAPTEADVVGADAIVITPPPGAETSAPEWKEYLALLVRLGSEDKLAGKVGAVVGTADRATVAAFSQAMLAAGLVLVPPASQSPTPEAATSHGRRVAAVARALKQAM